MKVEPECAACILSRASAEAKEATFNPALRYRVVTDMLRLLAKEFSFTAVPAELGTKRDRLIARVTGNSDPYSRSKRISNANALKLLPYARKMVEDGYTQQDRFKKACLAAIVGNIIEFDIPGHRFNSGSIRKSIREAAKDLTVDDTLRACEILKKANRVLYLTDNAGEIVFDTLLVEQLKNMGLTVIVAVKGGPIINDATMVDAEASGMNKIADKTMTTGSSAVGMDMKDVSPEFLEVYNSVDLIIAKGMGYAETLTEYKLKKPHLLLLRAKCNPVANYFGVGREKNVAKLIP